MRYLAVMTLLVLVELALAAFFMAGMLSGSGNNFLLGTILGLQFLVLAAVIIWYMRASLPARELVEDREEGMLW